MKRIVLAGILSLFALFSYAQEYQYHFLLAGASFAVPENGWFELVCDAFNAEAMNKAVSGDAIKHTASDMFYDRFYTDEELERTDAFIIMHVHNQDVASTTGIKENYEDYTHADIQQYNTAYDYVIKRYKADCYNLKNNPNSKLPNRERQARHDYPVYPLARFPHLVQPKHQRIGRTLATAAHQMGR